MSTVLEYAKMIRGGSGDLPAGWVELELSNFIPEEEYSGNGYVGKAYGLIQSPNPKPLEIVFVHSVIGNDNQPADSEDIYAQESFQAYANVLQGDAATFVNAILTEYEISVPADIPLSHTGNGMGALVAEIAAYSEAIEGATAITFNNPGLGGVNMFGPPESGFTSNIYQAKIHVANSVFAQVGTVHQLDTPPIGESVDDILSMLGEIVNPSQGIERILNRVNIIRTLYSSYAEYQGSIDTIINGGFESGNPKLVSSPAPWPSASTTVMQLFLKEFNEELAEKMAELEVQGQRQGGPSIAVWEAVYGGLLTAAEKITPAEMETLNNAANSNAETFQEYLSFIISKILTAPNLAVLATEGFLKLVYNVDVSLGGIGETPSALIGSSANDILISGDMDDHLFGGSGVDTLIGGKGKDVLWGGDVGDILWGGEGPTGSVVRIAHTGDGEEDIFVVRGGETIKDADAADYVSFFGSLVPTGGVKFAPFEAPVAWDPKGFAYRLLDGDINDAEGGTLEVKFLWMDSTAVTLEHYNRDFTTHTGDAHIEIYTETYGPRTGNWLENMIKGYRAAFDNAVSDPLVLDMDGNGFDLRSSGAAGVYFDVEGGDFAHRTGWVGGEDGFLVRDLNSNGTIDNIGEMFGNDTISGFDALAAYDATVNGGNGDGKIDTLDSVWADLKIWQDLNGNGITDSGELQSLGYHDIVEISLDSAADGSLTAASIPPHIFLRHFVLTDALAHC